MKRAVHESVWLASLISAVILIIPAGSCIEKSAHEKQLQPDIVLQWAKTYGDGLGGSVQQTSDGGYIVSGESRGRLLLMRLDNQGNKLWDRKFESEYGYWGKSVHQTSDGGYIVCASGGWLIKTDENGNKLWDKTFVKLGSNEVIATTDGYVICGWNQYSSTEREIRIIKTDENGDELWDKTYDKSYRGQANSILQSKDGGYLICGESSYRSTVQSLSELNIFLIKTDGHGNQLWEKKIEHGQGNSLTLDRDGDYIVCGTAYSSDTDYKGKIMLAKMDINGNKLWESKYGNKNGVFGHAAYPTTNDGYLIFGDAIYSRRSWSPTCAPGTLPPQVNLWLMKTDSQGKELWDSVFEDYSINSVQPTADGGFVLCGLSEREYPAQVVVLKFAPIQ